MAHHGSLDCDDVRSYILLPVATFDEPCVSEDVQCSDNSNKHCAWSQYREQLEVHGYRCQMVDTQPEKKTGGRGMLQKVGGGFLKLCTKC